ncbi:MAG: cytochrome c biogenesis protein ResB [Deltaproteobacteria bacterium]
MTSSPGAAFRRFLRSPWTITLEILGIALAGVSTTWIEQHPTPLARERLAEEAPAFAAAVRALAIDHVFTAPWFLALVALAAGSLSIVAWEQWKRLVRDWKDPGEGWFRSAPYRRVVHRAPTGEGRRVSIEVAGRLGAIGSPLFHTGLLAIAVVGVARMLFAADAARDVWEGGVLPAGPSGFETQYLGPLARPLELPEPVQFVELRPGFYPSGALLEFTALVRIGEPPGRQATVAVNEPLDLGAARLYLTPAFGPAAVVEIAGTASPSRGVILLAPGASGDDAWSGRMPDGLEVRMRARHAPGPARPASQVDVRVLRGDALLAAGRMQPGAVLDLPGGGSLALQDVRWWVRVAASRDPTAWPMFVGFGLAIAGVVLLSVFVRVDTMVVAEPDGDRERVTVAMRPQRLAPLFADRFERRVEREAGRR